MKKLLTITMIFFMALTFSCTTLETQNQEQTFVILHTNDTHGHPVKFFHYPMPDVGGLAARASFVKLIREQYDNVLVLDAGDLNTGRPESTFFHAEPDIIGYNFIGYDAVVFGNHEFDNSPQVLAKQIESAEFPFISANVLNIDGTCLTRPYIIKNLNGLKIAILGLTTKETALVGSPVNIAHLQFIDEVKAAKKLIPELKKQADIIIALTHLGIYESESYGSLRLAKMVNGIDIIVDGHSHTKLNEPIIVNNTYIVQAWQWGLVMGQAIVTVKNKKITTFDWQSVPINLKNVEKKDDGTKEITFSGEEYIEDAELLALLTPYNTKVDKLLLQKIGYSEGVFSNDQSRIQETAIGDLVSDSMLWYTKDMGVDFAVNNGGGIRADLPAGDILKRTVYEMLPYDNSVAVIELKGSDVISLFDFIASIPQGLGSFAQVSDGVKYTINYEKGTCDNLLINGQKVNPDKMYKIATNSYLATGGDGYKIFKNAASIYDTSAYQKDVFIKYIEFLKTVKPEIKNRIIIIGEKTAGLIYSIFKKTA